MANAKKGSRKKELGNISLDDNHYHEVLDRLHLVMSIIDDHLIQHPVCKIETDIKDLITDAQYKLWEAYQSIDLNKL